MSTLTELELLRVIGRLSGHTALVNCIALEEKKRKVVETEEEEDEEEEDFVASGSTDTTVRVGQQLISGFFANICNFAILHTHHCQRCGG